jgi:hypothetical protein
VVIKLPFRIILVQGILTGYELDGRDSIPSRVTRFFCTPQRPDQLESPSAILFIEYWVALSSGIKWPGRESGHFCVVQSYTSNFTKMNLFKVMKFPSCRIKLTSCMELSAY